MSTGGRMRWMTIALSGSRGEHEKSDDATAHRLGVLPPNPVYASCVNLGNDRKSCISKSRYSESASSL